MSSSHRMTTSLAFSIAAAAASACMAVLALDRASGATRRRGECCDTEFIDPAVLNTTWLLVPVIAIAALFSARIALLGLAGVAVPQFWAMSVAVDRYEDSGWGQGLEVLGYLSPLALTAVAAIGLVVGWQIGSHRRKARGQDQ